MGTLQTAVLIGHTLIALLIVILVLVQRGKGADAGAAFGSGASGTVFGARGSSSFFSRMTAVLATAFFATSLALAFMSSQRGEAPQSLIESAPVEEGEDAAPPTDELPELRPTDDAADELPPGDDLPTLESPETDENPQ